MELKFPVSKVENSILYLEQYHQISMQKQQQDLDISKENKEGVTHRKTESKEEKIQKVKVKVDVRVGDD